MATWDRYRNAALTSFEVRSQIGDPFFIRSFCDDPAGSVYITKDPVCKLSLSPTIQFVNTNIAWDMSGSRSATGTIDYFDITWGGLTDIGNLAAQPWAGSKSGNVQYTAVGTYLVTATVTDTLGNRSKPCKTRVTIVPPDLPTAVQRVYIGTTDNGCYIMTPTSAAAPSNSGLTGDALKFRELKLHPAYADLAPAQHHLWACTKSGLAYSTDGAATWSTISKATLGTPANDLGDSPAPATADLDQIGLAFDPQDIRRVYVYRTTATRSWLYYSDDYGGTWSNVQVDV